MQTVSTNNNSRFRRLKQQTLEGLLTASSALKTNLKDDIVGTTKMSDSIKRGTHSTIPSRAQNQTVNSIFQTLHKQTMPLKQELYQSLDNDYQSRMNVNNTIQHISKFNFSKRLSSISQQQRIAGTNQKFHKSFALSFIELQSNNNLQSGLDNTKNYEFQNQLLDSESIIDIKKENFKRNINDSGNNLSKQSPFLKTINLFQDLKQNQIKQSNLLKEQSQIQFKNFQRKTHYKYKSSGAELDERKQKNEKIQFFDGEQIDEVQNKIQKQQLQITQAQNNQKQLKFKQNFFAKKLIQEEISYDLKKGLNENFNFVNHYRNLKKEKIKQHQQNLYYIFKQSDIVQNEDSESYKLYIQKLKQIKEVIWTVENLKIEYEKQLIFQNINEPAHNNIQEHIIPFPSKNPLISMKEINLQEQDQQDLLPEDGFDYSKIYDQPKLKIKSNKQFMQKGYQNESVQEEEKDSYNCLQLSKVDKSLIKMEELEIEIKQMIMQASEDILNRIPQIKRKNCEFDAFQELEKKTETQEIKTVQLIKSEEGSYQIEDPIFTMYIQLLQMMSNLCINEDLPGIIIDYYRDIKNIKQPVISTFQMERDRKLQEKNNNRNKNSKKNDNSLKSAARDILIRSVIAQLTTRNLQILEFKKVKENDQDDEPTKLFIKQILQIIKMSFDEELQNPRNKKKKSNYIDMAGEQIQKILITAQKMKKDRIEKEKKEQINEQQLNQSSKNQESIQMIEKSLDEIKQQDKNQRQKTNEQTQNLELFKQESALSLIQQECSAFCDIFSKTNNLIQLLTNLGLNNEKTLQNLLQTRKNTVKKRKGLGILHYNFSNKHNINQIKQGDEQATDQQQLSESQIEEKRIQGQLFNYHAKTESQVVRFIDKTKLFLDYLYAEHASLFLFQKSYTMTDIFQFSPQYVIDYVDELQQVLTSVPLKYSILSSDYIDELSWKNLLSQEFHYNKDDHTYKLISQSMRNYAHLDSLGEKQQLFWKDEVFKRFNLISLLNFHFRDYVDSYLLDKELKNVLKTFQSSRKNRKSPLDSNKKKKKSFLIESFEEQEASYLCKLDQVHFWYEKRNKQKVGYQKNKLKNESQFDKDIIDEILLQDCQDQEYDIYSSMNKDTRYKIIDLASVLKIQFGGKYIFIMANFYLFKIEYFVQKDFLVLQRKQNSNIDNTKECIISYRKEDILLNLNSDIEIYLGHPQQTQKNNLSFLDKQETIHQQIQNSGFIDWKIFQTLKKRNSLPMNFLMKLSHQYQCPVKINIIDDFNQNKEYFIQKENEDESIYAAYFLKFNSYQVSQEIFGNLKNSIYRKTESQIGLDFFFNAQKLSKKKNGESKEDQDTSPFIMLVLSIVCQMKVSKYSECVIKKGQIPKALHVIVDGLASVISQEPILKDIQSSQYCRGKGLFEKDLAKEQIKIQKKSPSKIKKSPFMIEFGNMGNDNKIQDAPEIKNKKEVKEEIEFKRIKMCDYFGSRVLIDEAVLKNYIKDQKDDIIVWLRPPVKIHIDSVFRNFNSCWLMLSTVKGKLNRSDQSQKYSSNIQVKQKSSNKLDKQKTGIEQLADPSSGMIGEILDYNKIDQKMVDWDQDIVLKNVKMTREQFDLAQNEDIKQINKMMEKENTQEEEDGSQMYIKTEESLNNKEFKLMKKYLLTSQLSVVVKSHELKCMLIRKSDKVYFEERIKKIFDEKMKIYEFIDIDRPYKHLKYLEATKLNYMKWDLFKNQYENMILEEGYIQRKQSVNFSKNL